MVVGSAGRRSEVGRGVFQHAPVFTTRQEASSTSDRGLASTINNPLLHKCNGEVNSA